MSYYKISDNRRLKKVFRAVKGDFFRQFLLITFWRDREQQKRYFDGTAKGIVHFEEETRKSEFGHLIAGILIAVTTTYMLFLGQFLLALITMTLNVIANFYPVVLQRHHRMRTAIIQKRQLSRRS